NQMNRLPIGEVARRTGMRPSALRYYEEVGLIAPQPRDGGQRRYGPDVFNILAVIEHAKRVGFTIAETRWLLTGFGSSIAPTERWRSMAKRKEKELDQAIADARRMKNLLRWTLRCECVTLEECGRRLRTVSSR